MNDKLKFTLAEPEHKVLTIPMARQKWFELAFRNNRLRVEKGAYWWPVFQIEEVYAELHPERVV